VMARGLIFAEIDELDIEHARRVLLALQNRRFANPTQAKDAAHRRPRITRPPQRPLTSPS